MPARLRIHNQICGPDLVMRSRPRHGGERIVAALGIAPFRCQRCGVRFFRPVSRLAAAIWLAALIVVLGWGTMWLLTPPTLYPTSQAEARQDVEEACYSVTLPAPPCPVTDQTP